MTRPARRRGAVSTKPKPVGADLLRLFGPWLEGVELAAGRCLLADRPVPTRLFGERCGERGCPSVICGPTEALLDARMADHRRRCHR